MDLKLIIQAVDRSMEPGTSHFMRKHLDISKHGSFLMEEDYTTVTVQVSMTSTLSSQHMRP